MAETIIPEHGHDSRQRAADVQRGTPWAAAGSSLLTFAAGALAPLLPWFFVSGQTAQLASVAVAGVFALAIGGLLAHLGGRSWPWPALRQLLVIAIAAGATVLVGRL